DRARQHAGIEMVELADRLAGRLDDLGMAVAQDGAHLAGGEIEDLPAVGVAEVVALGAFGDDRRKGTAIAHQVRPGLGPERRIVVAAHAASGAASQAARTSGRRSLPKNIELPMNIVGLPKPPRAISSSVLARSRFLQSSVSMAAKKRCRSRPA